MKEVQSFAQVDFSQFERPAIAVYDHPDDDPKMCSAVVLDKGDPVGIELHLESVWSLEWNISHTTGFKRCERGTADPPELVSVWM